MHIRLSHICRTTALAVAAKAWDARSSRKMLVVEDLTCRFGSKTAVDRASFSIPRGSFIGVIGRSGAGKSTLLRMINRLAEPSEGKILFDGTDVTALQGAE